MMMYRVTMGDVRRPGWFPIINVDGWVSWIFHFFSPFPHILYIIYWNFTHLFISVVIIMIWFFFIYLFHTNNDAARFRNVTAAVVFFFLIHTRIRVIYNNIRVGSGPYIWYECNTNAKYIMEKKQYLYTENKTNGRAV